MRDVIYIAGPMPNIDLSHISDVDAAWIGGWLSADGSIGWQGEAIRVRWTITDLDPLERIADVVGDRSIHTCKPSGFGVKPRHCLTYTGHLAVALVHRCWPWLSHRYQERFNRFVAEWSPRPEGEGHKLNSADVAEIKRELASNKHGIGTRLAERFGVTDGLISAIKHGRVWREA